MAELKPPRKSTEVLDPGARAIDPEQPATDSDTMGSEQIPSLHVDNIGDDPELNSTDKQAQDTGADELDMTMDSTDTQPISADGKTKATLPGGLQIPKTVVEKVDPESPSYGEEPGTVAFDMRRADAEPDEVLKAPEITRTDLEGTFQEFSDVLFGERLTESGVPTSSINRYPDVTPQSNEAVENQSVHQSNADELDQGAEDNAKEAIPDTMNNDKVAQTPADDEDFGDEFDEFDEFEEGAEDDDFGGFSKPSINAESVVSPSNMSAPVPLSPMSSQLPNLNFGSLHSLEDIAAACQPYLEKMLPGRHASEEGKRVQLPEINTSFLTERSQALWAQLVAPPPLQPPDWIRSRIRRLFLVSLGVPVDLDEILPASKQKKLILPSTNFDGDKSPHRRTGTPVNGAAAAAKLKDENNPLAAPSSPGVKLERKRTGAQPPPELDMHSARYLCSTTDVALCNLSLEELQDHIVQLESLTERAKELLEYWRGQRDSAVGNQKAFEEVIENLVKHAQKIRK